MSDCPEIQDKVILADVVNNIYYDKQYEKLVYGNLWDRGKHVSHYMDLLIWLPRQDQLQAMITFHRHPERKETPNFCAYYMCFDFFQWIPRYGPPEGKGDINCNSMEQLWLAFVMWELHQKKWDGNKWRNNA